MSTAKADPLLHQHGHLIHSHPHRGRHRHLAQSLRSSLPIGVAQDDTDDTYAEARFQTQAQGRARDHAPSHGLVADSTMRSRDGIRAVLISLGVLGVAALAQTIIFLASGSVALLADVVHNFGDALTAVPLGIAFMLHSRTAERRAGLVIVAAILISACVAGREALARLVHPSTPGHLPVLALAGAIGWAGNSIAARIRTTAGRRLDSAALIADGHHARADAYVSLAVIASAAVIALGFPRADPIIGLGITVVILRITWQSLRTVRGHHSH